MNADIRQLLSDGERALRSEQVSAAREAFLEAGVVAAKFGLWRSALRCYKSALEIDLTDREVVQRIAAMPAAPRSSARTTARSSTSSAAAPCWIS